MKTLIVFREGHSGNFLKALVQNYPADQVQHRVNELHFKELRDITLTHKVDLQTQSRKFNQILRILPTHNIFTAIFNNFSKKILIEMTPPGEYEQWRNNTVLWYDRCYYNQVEYYHLIQQDIANNQYLNVVNFDRLLDIDYMSDILNHYFGQLLTDNQKELLKQYADQQLQADVNGLYKDMPAIIGNITDAMFEENPWFFANCVYRYELANDLVETQRTWTLDNCRTVQTTQDLLKLAQQYNRDKH
jgi:hypothetical protein